MTTPEAQRRRAIEQKWLLRAIAFAFAFQFIYQFAIVNPQADNTHTALCGLRTDLVNRVAQTQKFLQHPEDFPAFSDPKTVTLIRQQVEGQQRTIAVLSVLSCS